MDTGNDGPGMGLQRRLVHRAQRDQVFRAKLLSDPKAAIADELEMTLPDGLTVEVFEEKPGKRYFVLPTSPSELSDAQLEKIAAGVAVTSQTPHGGHYTYSGGHQFYTSRNGQRTQWT